MSIKWKINVFLMTLGVLASIFVALIHYSRERGRVFEEAFHRAELISSYATASRTYISNTLRPLAMKISGSDRFLPELMEAFFVVRSVSEIFSEFHTGYTVKQASVNPLNSKNKADAHEIELIDHFSNHSDQRSKRGVVEKRDGAYIYSAQPVAMAEKCLGCHGGRENVPNERAPQSPGEGAHGFGPGDVMAVLVTYAPVETALEGLKYTALKTALIGISGVFILVLALWFFIGRVISKPVVRLTRIANGISRGKPLEDVNAHDDLKIRDEISELTLAFFQMTEHGREAETALRESENRHKLILNAIKMGIVVVDERTHRIIDVNAAALEMIGRPKEKVTGSICHKYICPAEVGECPITDLGQRVDNSERLLLAADGKRIPILKTVTRSIMEGKPCLVESFIDITDRKKLEARLEQARKMEAIGTLAGGVAHDLNNVLSGIVSCPELLLMDLPSDSPMREPILTIQKSGEKAGAIVQDLLTLARRGVTAREVLNINRIISEHLQSPEFEKLRMFHPDIRVRTDFAEDLLNIIGSPIHMYKTVMNLVSNAAEAMPNGGEIRISTENRYIDAPVRGYKEIDEGDYIVMEVSDAGVGMPTEDMGSIFDPFYTKKMMGRSGTGLGMAVVWGVVKDHYGYIDIRSDVGVGSTFTLYFPATRRKAPEEDAREESADDLTGDGETILVVDDVEEQRSIAASMLTRLGYRVETVAGGEEAVERLMREPADLLVLDMIMEPGMDGLDTYKKIIELHPGQKAIIASGYSETRRVKEARELGAGAYVRKPYILKTIGAAVKAALAKNQKK